MEDECPYVSLSFFLRTPVETYSWYCVVHVCLQDTCLESCSLGNALSLFTYLPYLGKNNADTSVNNRAYLPLGINRWYLSMQVQTGPSCELFRRDFSSWLTEVHIYRSHRVEHLVFRENADRVLS